MCGGDPYDEPAVETRVWRKARKEHQCIACRETIRKGDRYHYWTQLWEGSWGKPIRHCARCYAICKALWKVTNGEGIEVELNCGELWDDNFGEPPEEVARLAFMSADDAQRELVP